MITRDQIKTLAQEVGFHACGITVPKPIREAEDALREWNKQGKHGEMKYLENYEFRRNRFWENFGKARSVIVLGVNYFSKQSQDCHAEPFVCHSERPPRRVHAAGRGSEESQTQGKLREASKNRDPSPYRPSAVPTVRHRNAKRPTGARSSGGTGRQSGRPPLNQPAASPQDDTLCQIASPARQLAFKPGRAASLGALPRNDDRLVGRVARYAWGEDYHRVISKKLEALKERIKQEAGQAIHFESAVDTKPLLERTLAQRAGLGFIGKQTQLLSLQFGPWLFLAELVTDLELEPDEPFYGSCGTCRLCIDECPTEAIEETGHIDARKCIAYLTIEHKTEIPSELRPKIGNWVFGCDECLNVCPYTAKQKETDWRELTSETGFGSELDLLRLFEIKGNREYQRKFRASPISRANRKQLLRNAAVVLGNSGSIRALPVLEKAANDPSLLVREHVRWAIDQIREKVSCTTP